MNKNLKIAGLILLIAIVAGGYYFPKNVATIQVQGSSSAGVANSSAKVASITMAPALAAGTTTGILNTDSADRGITSSFVSCVTVGSSLPYLTGMTSGSLPAWGVQMSTSSATGVGLGGNLNYVSNITIATTSAWSYNASSTLPTLGPVTTIWPTGTYLNIVFNATNTAACTVGVNYLSL